MIISDLALLTKENQIVSLEESSGLIDSLDKELNHSALMGRPGVGLACPQIGINKKAAIIRIGNTKLNLINAVIEHKYSPFVFKGEGCLSFINEVMDTTRYQEIHVTGNLVEPHAFVASGFIAVVIQHELDHLDGITFHQRAVPPAPAARQRPNDFCKCGRVDSRTRHPLKYKKCCGVKIK